MSYDDEYKTLVSRNDNDDDEDYPPNLTSLMHEQEKCTANQ